MKRDNALKDDQRRTNSDSCKTVPLYNMTSIKSTHSGQDEIIFLKKMLKIKSLDIKNIEMLKNTVNKRKKYARMKFVIMIEE